MRISTRGQFWLPGSADRTEGVLQFSRRTGARLTVGKPLQEVSEDIALIQGQAADGAYLTLLNVRCTDWLRHPPQYRYHSTMLLRGLAFDEPEKIRLSALQLSVPGLIPWAGVPGFNDEIDDEKTTVTLRKSKSRTLLSNPGLTLFLSYSNTYRVTRHSRSLRQTIEFEVRFNCPTALAETLRVAKALQQLMTLARGEPINVGLLKSTFDHVDPEGGEKSVQVEILFQQVLNARKALRCFPDDFLFTLRDIEGMEQDLFEKWLSTKRELAAICDLYFGTLFNPSKYVELNFLALAQAIEAYHRYASGETDLPPGEHEARVRSILNTTPDAHRQWLKQKLEFSNEMSLRGRLKYVFDLHALITDPLFRDRRKKVIDQIVNDRNDLIHRAILRSDDGPTNERLAKNLETLRLLVQACLFHELGFGADKVAEMLCRSKSFRLIQHLNGDI